MRIFLRMNYSVGTLLSDAPRYVQTRWEDMILQTRADHIMADQMDFLRANLTKGSRLGCDLGVHQRNISLMTSCVFDESFALI